MRIKITYLFIITSAFFLSACSTQMDFNKYQKRAIDTSNNKPVEFVVLTSKDTLKGPELKFRYYKATFSSPPIKYEGKKISFKDIVSYQNKDAYCLLENNTHYALYRICQGKINMYYSLPASSQSPGYYGSGPQGTFHSGTSTTTKTLDIYFTNNEKDFYWFYDTKKLNELIKNNPAALKKYDEYIRTAGKKKYISYPKVYEIIKIYNGNNT